VFHCTIAHNPSVFWDPKMLEFYLAAAQFALGDLAAPTTPSAKLTEAVRAQEKLGWRVALSVPLGEDSTLFDAIDRAAEFGLLAVSANYGMKVSDEIAVPFDSRLNDEQRKAIRLKLDAACVRLLACRFGSFGGNVTMLRRRIGFFHKMGIETTMITPSGENSWIPERYGDFDVRMVPDDKAAATGKSPIYLIDASRNIPKAEIIAAVERINQLSIQQAQKGQP
jgi:hypothetical protein